MRHIEKKRSDFRGVKKISNRLIPANIRPFHAVPTTPTAMRHFGQGEKRRNRKTSQTVSLSQIVSLVSDRLTFAEYGESSPYPRHPDGDLPLSAPRRERDAVSVTPPRYTSYLPIASFFSASSVVNPPLPSWESACPVLRYRGWGEGSLSPLPSWERARAREMVNRNIKTMLTRHWPSDSSSPGKSHDRVITNASTHGYIDAIT